MKHIRMDHILLAPFGGHMFIARGRFNPTPVR